MAPVPPNLTQDDDDEAAPLTLTEEDHSAAQLTALDDGSAVLEDAPDAEGSTAPSGPLNAEPDNPRVQHLASSTQPHAQTQTEVHRNSLLLRIH
eukprot:COSAG01_NODE_11036_length_2022_cov_44.337493_4_plen_94_part_00